MDIEALGPIIIGVIVLLFRLLSKKNKTATKKPVQRRTSQPTGNRPTPKPAVQRQNRPNPTTTSTNPFDDIFKELMAEATGQKPKPKPKPTPKKEVVIKPEYTSIEYQEHDEVHPKSFDQKIKAMQAQRNIEESKNELEAIDFDLEQAVIYDAVLNRPWT